MNDDQFTKLLEYVSQRFDGVDSQLQQKATAQELDKVFTLLDHVSKKTDINDDERLVMGHQLERLDKWDHELADKIGYSLSP